MAESLIINKNLSDEEVYISIIPQIKNLLNSDEPVISNLSNVTAVLKEAFDKISWVGFYLLKDNDLYLGPFQGKVACTLIKLGNGVCGTSASKKETIIVEDVDKFPGHIACDSGSKSEIVVPILNDGNLIGVLDVDSYEFSSFNSVDKKYIEEICELITQKINFTNFTLN